MIGLLGCGSRSLPGDRPPPIDAAQERRPQPDLGADTGDRHAAGDVAGDAPATGSQDGGLDRDSASLSDSGLDGDGAVGDAVHGSPLAAETDLLAISKEEIREMTFDGRVIASRPTGLFAGEAVRGAALSSRRILHLQVGSVGAGATVLRSFDLVTGAVTERTTSGLTLPGVVGVGGVAVHDSFAWVVDGATAGAGFPEGLVRFDLETGMLIRVPTPEANRFTLDVTWGVDGKLHSLTSDVILTTFDSQTMTLIGETQLVYSASGLPIRGVAVAADGRAFAAAEHGQLLRFSASGDLEATFVSKAYYLTDVDVDRKGHVVASGDDGIVVITDLELTSVLTIELPSANDGPNDIEVVIVDP